MAEVDFDNLRRAREGVTAHELRRYLAGELDEKRRVEIAAQLENDVALKAEHDALEAEKRAFQTALPFSRFAAEQEERARPQGLLHRLFAVRFAAGAVGSFAAVAAAVLLVVFVDFDTVAGDPVQTWGANQIKGGEAKLGFFVREGDKIRLGVDGEALMQGAQIQFAVVDKAEASAMVIVGVDGKGAVSTYATHALSGREKGAQKARLLEQSLVLDDALGAERFFVVYGAESAGRLQQLSEDAARALVASGADLTTVERLPLDDALTQGSVHILKVR